MHNEIRKLVMLHIHWITEGLVCGLMVKVIGVIIAHSSTNYTVALLTQRVCCYKLFVYCKTPALCYSTGV